MCLGVPGRVSVWIERDPLLALAEIDFGGVRKRIQMACVPEAQIGDYVLVHAGVALTIIDPVQAERTLRTLKSCEPLSEEHPPGKTVMEAPQADRTP